MPCAWLWGPQAQKDGEPLVYLSAIGSMNEQANSLFLKYNTQDCKHALNRKASKHELRYVGEIGWKLPLAERSWLKRKALTIYLFSAPLDRRKAEP